MLNFGCLNTEFLFEYRLCTLDFSKTINNYKLYKKKVDCVVMIRKQQT